MQRRLTRPYLTPREASLLLGVCDQTVRNWIRKDGAVLGVKAVHKAGNQYVIPRIALMRALTGETVEPDTTAVSLPDDWWESR